MMRWFSGSTKTSADAWEVDFTTEGVRYTRTEASDGLSSAALDSALVQWADAGHAFERDAQWHIGWRSLYELLGDPDVEASASSLGLPQILNLVPRLVSRISDGSGFLHRR